MKIVLCDFSSALPVLKSTAAQYIRKLFGAAAEIEVRSYRDESSLQDALADADGLLTAFAPVTRRALASCTKLRGISVIATGYDTIDIPAASEFGIPVCHVREYCTQEVAEHTLALLLALNRNLKEFVSATESRKWSYTGCAVPKRLEGQTIGIFGFGRIGRAVAARCRAFGMRVLAADPFIDVQTAQNAGAELTDRATLLRESDVISNHMNQTAENKGFFCYDLFRQTAKKPIFLNVARGDSTVESDLARALDEGLLRGAGLDVLESAAPDLTDSPLLGRKNVLVTPHIAYYSDFSYRLLFEISVRNLWNCLNGHPEDAFSCLNLAACAADA